MLNIVIFDNTFVNLRCDCYVLPVSQFQSFSYKANAFYQADLFKQIYLTTAQLSTRWRASSWPVHITKVEKKSKNPSYAQTLYFHGTTTLWCPSVNPVVGCHAT